MKTFIQQIKQQLQQPLPGATAQYKMAHVVRRQGATPLPSARQAGVLALFYKKDQSPHLVLTKRVSTHAKDKHSGQMSFPGGQVEPSDKNMGATALRETEEEVGILASKIELLGALTPLYIPISNFMVHPFVGYLDEVPQFIPQTSEVQSIVETPLALLQNPANRQLTDLRINPAITLKSVPYFNVYDHVVWGATAMILSELLEVVH